MTGRIRVDRGDKGGKDEKEEGRQSLYRPGRFAPRSAFFFIFFSCFMSMCNPLGYGRPALRTLRTFPNLLILLLFLRFLATRVGRSANRSEHMNRIFIYYNSPRNSIAKIKVDIPTVDFVDLKNVGLSGCLLGFELIKGRSTDHTAYNATNFKRYLLFIISLQYGCCFTSLQTTRRPRRGTPYKLKCIKNKNVLIKFN